MPDAQGNPTPQELIDIQSEQQPDSAFTGGNLPPLLADSSSDFGYKLSPAASGQMYAGHPLTLNDYPQYVQWLGTQKYNQMEASQSNLPLTVAAVVMGGAVLGSLASGTGAGFGAGSSAAAPAAAVGPNGLPTGAIGAPDVVSSGAGSGSALTYGTDTGGLLNQAPAAAAPAAAAPAAAPAAAAAAPAVEDAGGLLNQAPNGMETAVTGGAASAADSAAGLLQPASSAAATTFDTVTKFLGDNKDIVAGILKGLGSAYEASAERSAQLDLLDKKQDLISANYRGADPSKGYKPLATGTQTQTPDQRFGPSNVGHWQPAPYEYQFDPRQGKIVKVPTPPTQAAAQ